MRKGYNTMTDISNTKFVNIRTVGIGYLNKEEKKVLICSILF